MVRRLVPWIAGGCLAVFAVLAVLAAIDDGEPLRRWDVTVQRRVEDARPAGVTRLIRHVTNLGGSQMMVGGGAVLIVLAWRRSRPLAIVVLVALAARPLLESGLKALIDRPRPDLSPLVHARGPSFPSGHALAAVSLWAMLPRVVGLYTRQPWLRRASVMLAVIVIAGVGFSRVYLGVHWTTDVLGAFVLAVPCLVALDRFLPWVDAHYRPTGG